MLERPLSISKVKEIVQEAVDLELAFVREALPDRLIGMNVSLMSEYVLHCTIHACAIKMSQQLRN